MLNTMDNDSDDGDEYIPESSSPICIVNQHSTQEEKNTQLQKRSKKEDKERYTESKIVIMFRGGDSRVLHLIRSNALDCLLS